MTEALILAVLVALCWLWWDSTQAREVAVRAARTACEAEGLQFLDDTVGISHLKPARDDDGRLKLQRTYTFEYSDTGNNRLPGSVVMLGPQVLLLNLQARTPDNVYTLH